MTAEGVVMLEWAHMSADEGPGRTANVVANWKQSSQVFGTWEDVSLNPRISSG